MKRKESVVREKSFLFAVRIVRLYQHLCSKKREYVLSIQILKSGTSVGANIEEADGAISRKEFSSKISIACKEAQESHYWLRLLRATEYINQKEYESLIQDCNEICKLLFAILRTTRINKR
jgi:four helix bundle protein